MEGEIKYPAPLSFTKTWHTKPYPFISPSQPQLSATGKNVVVTRGGTGIGNAIAVAFAQAGAKSVSIIGRRPDKLQTDAEIISAAAPDGATEVLFEVADLLNRVQVDQVVHSIVNVSTIMSV
ncbi:hypothetical protein BBP40_006913 [Aspergillus hancockii]|nr:hypothetical protein BBP40_006913 [Aspergillus hancockii]